MMAFFNFFFPISFSFDIGTFLIGVLVTPDHKEKLASFFRNRICITFSHVNNFGIVEFTFVVF